MSPGLSTRVLRSIWATNDLDVLVVDRHALGTVDVLHFLEEVVVERFFTFNPQDVLRDQRAVDDRGAGFDVVAGVDQQVAVLRDVVIDFEARARTVTMTVILPLRLSLRSSTVPVISAMIGRFLRLTRFEDFGDPGQTADDVGRAGRGAGLAGEHVAGLDLVAFGLTSMRALAGK